MIIILVIVLVCGLVQLASRSVLIATAVFSLAGLLFLVAERKVKKGFAITVVAIGTLLVLVLTRIDSFQHRFITEFRKDLATGDIEAGYSEPRAERWRGTYDLILASPFAGYGSGSEKRLLKEKYFEQK